MFKLLTENFPYTGAELRPHWISEQTGYFGDAWVAFCGPCKVPTQEMVDLEDSRAGKFIQAESMLHFLAESFSADLREMILEQRLFIAGFAELLAHELRAAGRKEEVRRDGNDLFVQIPGSAKRKLSVSIVTASAVSSLLHFGVNIEPAGAPVAAVGLRELGIEPRAFAEKALQSWSAELAGVRKARCKVRPRD